MTEKFYYKAERDIVTVVASMVLTVVGAMLLEVALLKLTASIPTEENANLFSWVCRGVYTLLIVEYIIYKAKAMYARRHQRLEIGNGQLVYYSGGTLHKFNLRNIADYEERQTILQTICGSTDLWIYTEDGKYIRFRDMAIEDGELACELMEQ